MTVNVEILFVDKDSIPHPVFEKFEAEDMEFGEGWVQFDQLDDDKKPFRRFINQNHISIIEVRDL